MMGLPDGEKSLRILNRLDTIPACDRQTDRRTDGRASFDGIVHAMHSQRAVKIGIMSLAALCGLHLPKII